MSQRKRYNHKARLATYYRAMLRKHHVAVLDIDHLELQTLIDWKKPAAITSNSRLAIVEAVTEIPHRWSIYLAALSRDQRGEAYMKSVEVAPQGNYNAEQIRDVIEAYCVELKAASNPNHFIGLAWIAIPAEVTLTEAQAERVFDAFGAWRTKEAA
ncbi:hypothetical protein [Ectopseudomonas khazarica]|uniref:hypothetical protein n=1 Tax=Ectopseudomonas khazarica TaxID=2502979 RepID=UPI003A910A08